MAWAWAWAWALAWARRTVRSSSVTIVRQRERGMGRRGARQRHAPGVCVFLRTYLGRRWGREGARGRERRARGSLARAGTQYLRAVPSRRTVRKSSQEVHPPSAETAVPVENRRGVAVRAVTSHGPPANGVRERGRGKRGAQPGEQRNGGREIAFACAEPCLRLRSSRIIKVVRVR